MDTRAYISDVQNGTSLYTEFFFFGLMLEMFSVWCVYVALNVPTGDASYELGKCLRG